MTGSRTEDAEDQALLAFLAAQRASVLSIVAGLDDMTRRLRSSLTCRRRRLSASTVTTARARMRCWR
jgi:hypothetical protein